MAHGATIDWAQHRSQGYAAVVFHKTGSRDAAYFDAPLISHIVDNLWMGGCQDRLPLDDDFVKVVSLYPWEKYTLGDNTERVEVKMYDAEEGVDLDDLERASEAVLEGLEKGKTLVHCQAGLNRSGLVSAYTMMKLGYRAEDAIQLLRDARSPLVLCNETFEKQLLDIQEKIDELAAAE